MKPGAASYKVMNRYKGLINIGKAKTDQKHYADLNIKPSCLLLEPGLEGKKSINLLHWHCYFILEGGVKFPPTTANYMRSDSR